MVEQNASIIDTLARLRSQCIIRHHLAKQRVVQDSTLRQQNTACTYCDTSSTKTLSGSHAADYDAMTHRDFTTSDVT